MNYIVEFDDSVVVYAFENKQLNQCHKIWFNLFHTTISTGFQIFF